MKISKRQLIEMNACKDGLKRFIDQTNNTSELVDVASLVGGKNTYDDLLWLAEKTISEERIVRFACDCALLNIELIKPYTDQYSYNLIVEFLKDPSKNAMVKAGYAAAKAGYVATANDDYDASNASYAAAYSTYNTTYSATNAANNAANITTYNASYNAANAANNANEKEVNKLLIEMFNEYGVKTESSQSIGNLTKQLQKSIEPNSPELYVRESGCMFLYGSGDYEVDITNKSSEEVDKIYQALLVLKNT